MNEDNERLLTITDDHISTVIQLLRSQVQLSDNFENIRSIIYLIDSIESQVTEQKSTK